MLFSNTGTLVEVCRCVGVVVALLWCRGGNIYDCCNGGKYGAASIVNKGKKSRIDFFNFIKTKEGNRDLTALLLCESLVREAVSVEKQRIFI
jgi:hypothetical protein